MKHAIVMICHNNSEVVETALKLLDDKRFSCYLMIDKKSHLSHNQFCSCLKNSKCVVVKPKNMNYCGWSYCEGVMSAIECAVKDGNDYIHILQGADLPLKTPDEIDDYFTRSKGTNFFDIDFISDCDEMNYRMKCKHLFLDNRFFRQSRILHGVNYLCAKLQQKLFIKKNDGKYYFSSALFSITGEFAKYLIGKIDKMRKEYRYSYGGDEICFGTEFMNSPYADTLSAYGNCRFIDWKRREKSSPHTFTIEDKDLIEKCINDSNLMFARKFSETVDMAIVKHVEAILKQKL